MKDWADLEAEREVDALTPAVPPMASQPVASNDPGTVVGYQPNPCHMWRHEVIKTATSIGVVDQINYNECVCAFVCRGQILITEEAWLFANRDCVLRLEKLAPVEATP